jgi:germination protein M
MPYKVRALFLTVMFFVVVFVSGCDGNNPVSTKPPENIPNKPAAEVVTTPQETHVTVYYATGDAMYLAPEVRVVPKTVHPAQTALELLLSQPANRELVKLFPEGTKLIGLTIKDNIAYANFSDKLLKGNFGSASEILLVGAIVNTLTEFPEIHKVQILVEGKKVETIGGHLDVSEPLSRSEQIIKKELVKPVR